MGIAAVLKRAVGAAATRPERAVFFGAAAATAVAGVCEWGRVGAYVKPLMVSSLQVGLGRGARDRDIVDNVLLFTGTTAALVGDCVMAAESQAETRRVSEEKLVRASLLFTVTQTAYAAVLARHGARPDRHALVTRALALLGGGTLVATEAPTLLPPLALYGASLGVASAFAADRGVIPAAAPGDDPRRGLEAGGVAFVVSDALVVNRRYLFTGEITRRITEAGVVASYALAQMLLVDGLEKLTERKR